MDKKLLDKMKKLLAMSQDTSSEHEAMIATKRLHALLAKHNVSMSDLEREEEVIGEVTLDKEVNWPWKRWVLSAVSELYFCSCYLIPVKKNYMTYAIVGSEANRLFAHSLIKNIFRVIETQAKVESKKYYGSLDSSFITSFRNGAGRRISDRCHELIRKAKVGELTDEEGNKLPVLLSVYEQTQKTIADWMEINLDLAKGRKSSTRTTDAAGYQKGKEAGDKVGLHRGVQQENAPKQIGRQ